MQIFLSGINMNWKNNFNVYNFFFKCKPYVQPMHIHSILYCCYVLEEYISDISGAQFYINKGKAVILFFSHF